ncbi:cation transport protein-domain-containing protein [Syncephalastrum racemosum]|uniref:Cation transport protein-domain-containing protein n=1 Tax=Syncephalastrum racemosum TaxID=13706 RepID=A0A1X2HR12_SYNRA|nr:cation transport protein-domain-containing protein [Syncephalastrum racemosum]
MLSVSSAWGRLKSVRFLTLHYAYIMILIFLGSAMFYFEPNTHFEYIDTLFMITTSVTNTGLNTLAMSSMSTYQLLLLIFFTIPGSPVIVSWIIVLVRKHYFSKRFKDVLAYNRQQKEYRRRMRHTDDAQSASSSIFRRLSMQSVTSDPSGKAARLGKLPSAPALQLRLPSHDDISIRVTDDATSDAAAAAAAAGGAKAGAGTGTEEPAPPAGTNTVTERTRGTSDLHGVMFAEDIEHQRREIRDEFRQHHKDAMAGVTEDDMLSIMLPTQPLTREQRYAIGGLEYRGLDFLAWAVPILYVSIIIICTFVLRIYVAVDGYAQHALATANSTPVDPWFWSFFLTVSSLNSLGLSLTDSSMVPFLNAPCPLILSAVLIIIGAPGYPILFRAFVWCLRHTSSSATQRETLQYLLDHPRRCYTAMFPRIQTMWLLIILTAITVIEMAAFLGANANLPVLYGIPWASRVLDSFYQGVSTRNAGFTVVNVLDLGPGCQMIYIIFMYLSIYPVAISIKSSNVYQERALGIYGSEHDFMIPATADRISAAISTLRRVPTNSSALTQSLSGVFKRPSFFVITQIQRQLISEICWLMLGIFCLFCAEQGQILAPSPVTGLSVIYECTSAFGNAGSSTGYPNTSTAQAAQYSTFSKVVLIILMYRGRQRALPSDIDRAVLLPSEQLQEKEVAEARFRARHAEASLDLGDNEARWYKAHSVTGEMV